MARLLIGNVQAQSGDNRTEWWRLPFLTAKSLNPDMVAHKAVGKCAKGHKDGLSGSFVVQFTTNSCETIPARRNKHATHWNGARARGEYDIARSNPRELRPGNLISTMYQCSRFHTSRGGRSQRTAILSHRAMVVGTCSDSRPMVSARTDVPEYRNAQIIQIRKYEAIRPDSVIAFVVIYSLEIQTKVASNTFALTLEQCNIDVVVQRLLWKPNL